MEYSGRNSKKAGVTEADREQERGTDNENESKEAATGQILYSPGSVLGSNKERNVTWSPCSEGTHYLVGDTNLYIIRLINATTKIRTR